MISLKFIKQKYKPFLLDTLLVSLITVLLVLTREIMKYYLDKIQTYIPQINELSTTLSTQNLTSYNPEQVESTLNLVNTYIQRIEILQYLILPLTIILLWILLQGLVWKLINKTSFKRFAIVSIPFLASLFFLVINLINIQARILYGDEGSILLFVISLILFLIITYETFIYCTINKPFKKTKLQFSIKNLKLAFIYTINQQSILHFSIKNLKKLALRFSLLLFISFLLLITIALIYISTYVKINIIIPSIIAIILIFILNIQRINLIERIKHLNK